MANNKRSGKFYRKNEAEIMEFLGFSPTPNSGSGWVCKEDGINEFAICQLKSTDAQSIKIDLKDVRKLEYNALVSHKIPVFAIQFLQDNEIFLVLRPENLQGVCNALKCDTSTYNQEYYKTRLRSDFEGLRTNLKKRKTKPSVKSGDESREKFMQEYKERFEKQGKSAR